MKAGNEKKLYLIEQYRKEFHICESKVLLNVLCSNELEKLVKDLEFYNSLIEDKSVIHEAILKVLGNLYDYFKFENMLIEDLIESHIDTFYLDIQKSFNVFGLAFRVEGCISRKKKIAELNIFEEIRNAQRGFYKDIFTILIKFIDEQSEK